MKILLLVALSMTSSPDPSTADGSVPQATYQALSVSLTQHHVIPRYQRLAEATKALDDAGRRFCEVQNPDNRYEGPLGDRVPLVALHRGRGELVTATAPDQVWQRMRQYCGSVAFDRSGNIFAVSAPRGNLITCWEASGRYLCGVELEDGCGVAPGIRPLEFRVTSGTGAVGTLALREGMRPRLNTNFSTPGFWDNHLVAAG